jgi:glycine/D-amino acid oxidase-like deaminating enzyme
MDEKWVVPPEDDPLTIKPTPGASDRLKKVAKYVSGGVLASAEHIADQACYMPCAVDGEPVFGHIPGCDGAFIATGTAEWGITMGPAMGKLMAELITGQKPSISIDYFSPRRIPNGYTLQTRIPVEQQKKPTAR